MASVVSAKGWSASTQNPLLPDGYPITFLMIFLSADLCVSDGTKSKIMNANEEVRKLGDKRKLKRFSDRLKISFNINGVAYRGLSSNFSVNGLFIRTNHPFPPDTLLDIIIYLPNDLTSHLKGKVVRASYETLWGVSGKARGYAERGIGIEIIEKDAVYLHFIRSFLSLEGRDIFRQVAFTEQEEKYQEIEAENIPDNVPFELLQPSLPADKVESGIEDSAKSDDTASKDFLLLPSPERVGQYNLFDDNFQHDETDEALNNIKISHPPAIGLKYEGEASSQDEKNSNSFDGDHQITQENTNKIFEKDKSSSSISKWIIFIGSIIIASLFILNLFVDKGYRQSFERQTLVISSQKNIAPKNGTERKEADLQQQKKQENRYQVKTKTPQENKQNTYLQQTGAIRHTSVNKDLQSSQSNKRSRQNLSTTGRYSMQIGLTVYKKGRGTVTDIGGGALIDCGSICSTLVNGVLYLTATPDVGSVFIKWLGCDSVDVNKVCMVNMVSQDRAVTAIFEGEAR